MRTRIVTFVQYSTQSNVSCCAYFSLIYYSQFICFKAILMGILLLLSKLFSLFISSKIELHLNFTWNLKNREYASWWLPLFPHSSFTKLTLSLLPLSSTPCSHFFFSLLGFYMISFLFRFPFPPHLYSPSSVFVEACTLGFLLHHIIH